MAIHNKTHDLWRFFWHSISLQKDSSIFHMFPSHEMDEPHRWSNSLIVRLPGTTRGIVLGFWRNTGRTEQEALLDALAGRQMKDDEFLAAEKVHLRRTMIKKQFSAEKQALLVDALDL